MRHRYIAPVLVAAGTLGFFACKETGKTGTSGGSGESSAASAKGAVDNGASLADRVAANGFAKNLPIDTEAVFTFYQGKRSMDSILNSKLLAAIRADEESIPSNEALKAMAEYKIFENVVGEEITVALGAGTAEQTKKLMELQQLVGFINTYTTAKSYFSVFSGGGSLGDLAENPYDFTKYGKEITSFLDGAKMPPLTIAMKVSDAGMRKDVLTQLKGSLEQAITEEKEVFAPSEKKIGDSTFTGHTITGEKAVALLEESILAEMPADTQASVKELLSKRNLHLLTGEMGDYLILFLGDSVDDLKFVTKPEESVLANKEFANLDPFLKKDRFWSSFIQEKMLDTLIQSNKYNQSQLSGLIKAVTEMKDLGDTREAVALFEDAGKHFDQFTAMGDGQTATGVGFYENGISFEGFGGITAPASNFKSQRTMASVSERSDAFMSASWAGNKDATAHVYDGIESLSEGAYLLAKNVMAKSSDAEEEPEEEDVEEVEDDGEDEDAAPSASVMQGQFAMMDSIVKEPLVKLWNAFRNEVGAGLGDEHAFVIDFNGAIPELPIPQTSLKGAKLMPRIAFARTVKDRAKLATGWDTIKGQTNGLLESIASMSGGAGGFTSMPEPMSSDKAGLTTWFFAMPFFTDDLSPSVSISDKHFFVSTSKSLSESIASSQGQAAEGGMDFVMNFSSLQQVVDTTLELMDKSPSEFFGEDEEAMAKFKTDRANYTILSDTFGGIGKFKTKSRMENGQLRSSTNISLKSE